MRVIEIYIKHSGIIFEDISFLELQSTHRNNYLSGFMVDGNLKQFSIIK
jgi:hypothetical protein